MKKWDRSFDGEAVGSYLTELSSILSGLTIKQNKRGGKCARYE